MKKIILLATTLLLTAQSFAAPGICYSCLGIVGAPDVPPTPISSEQLSDKLGALSPKDLSVCFTTSICIAGVEGALSSQAVASLLNTVASATPGSSGSSNYSENFKKVMGIGDVKEAKQIMNPNDITEIQESGFVNFYDKRSLGFTHTGYIHYDVNKIPYLYTTNKADLVNALSFSDGVPVGKTSLIRHPLTPQKAKDLTDWISGSYDVYYQPSSVVKTNIDKFLPK